MQGVDLRWEKKGENINQEYVNTLVREFHHVTIYSRNVRGD